MKPAPPSHLPPVTGLDEFYEPYRGDKAAFLRAGFGVIAHEYDRLVRRFSLGLDSRARREFNIFLADWVA